MLLALTLLSWAALPVAAQKVYVDYDDTTDFDAYQTFAWAPTLETSLQGGSPLVHSRVKNAIEYRLSAAGLIEVVENPDIYVTYHTDTKDEVTFHTSSFGYGYGSGWVWDPRWDGALSTSTTSAHTYERGSLVIDIWDANRKRAIWRGTATAVVKDNPERQVKQIEKAIAKMVQKFADYRRPR